MRFAQRSPGFHSESEQQVQHFSGPYAEDVAEQIAEVVKRYAVRIVSMTAWNSATGRSAQAIVVFEEEPDRV